ncbi:2-hydroxy-5-methyl-1-naphthoate 7-hydroxylase [Streptomyces xanthophaeus]|uniref:hypothetical protein n=1 Tax=Streptomyces xanthophaeus TaxID=67385 RepID=UPI00233EF4CA|nr:hypothetical protein [Streptomyces xanthophaeus]WCD90099.1 2-hydroxy-5-methyl-1-naphthoate 7-hydroxylase [Streptomyces xanthophaeus]
MRRTGSPASAREGAAAPGPGRPSHQARSLSAKYGWCPHQFSSDSRNWHAIQNGTLAPDSPLRPITAWQSLVALTDGAEQARLREAVTDSLGRVDKHRMRRYSVRYATQLIDDFAGKGRADLVADFSRKLPALVICQQLGLPQADALARGQAVSDMISGGAAALAGHDLVVRTVQELVRSRKQNPREDVASWLVAHPQGLSEEEVCQHLRPLLVGALEPTANLIANTLRLVLTDSRFRGNLSGGRMTLPGALEQVLWDHPPRSPWCRPAGPRTRRTSVAPGSRRAAW